VTGPGGDAGACTLEIDGRLLTARLSTAEGMSGTSWSVSTRLGGVELTALPRFPDSSQSSDPGATTAPMPGSVLLVAVSVGDVVTRGDLMCVIEAMKMEQRVLASADGTVTEILVKPGDQVEAGQLLVAIGGAR
jgi:propionyl-CoA carboxylase alpha chain